MKASKDHYELREQFKQRFTGTPDNTNNISLFIQQIFESKYLSTFIQDGLVSTHFKVLFCSQYTNKDRYILKAKVKKDIVVLKQNKTK